MKFPLLILLLPLAFASCTTPSSHQVAEKKEINLDSLKNVLMQTDLTFSDLSLKKGTHEAFITYVGDNGTLLRPYHMPIAGKEAIRSYLFAAPDTAFTLTWKPLYADVSRSGDLGYTYGTYRLDIKNSKEFEEGTYCSIWKIDSGGNWKYVLDTGNPGINPKKQLTN
jgi:ketosteroid isomerase-like protein